MRVRCPYCNKADTKVLETRETSEAETRRRRECLKCSKRFTTYEQIEQVPLLVVKKDGKREQFDKQKLRRGILHSCEKRPVSAEKIEEMVSEVEMKLRNHKKLEVKSTHIGELIMRRLRKVDKVAYIRFASVYRDFTDLESFATELEKLLEERNKKVKA